jgi:outer membrane protein assembly factor BamB
MRTVIIVLSLTVLAISAHAADALATADPEPAWPMYHGPFGNFLARSYGVALRDVLGDDLKPVWTAKARLGMAKGRPWAWQGYIDNCVPPGSDAAPIIAQGMVFATSFRPRGPVPQKIVDELTTGPLKDKAARYIATCGSLDSLAGVTADDVCVAVDLDSGAIRWEAVEEGAGLSHPMGKRNGFGVSPAYAAGRVFCMGSTGNLYAYEAATGKKLWQADIGPHRQTLLKLREAGTHGPGDMECSLVVAGDVVVAPVFDQGSLAAYDQVTGAQRWRIAEALLGQTTPGLFRDGQRTLVLAGARKSRSVTDGIIRCIDPADGKVLWTIAEGLAPPLSTLVANDGLLAVKLKADLSKVAYKGNPSRGQVGGTPKAGCRLGVYRITASGATLAWAVPDEPAWHAVNHPDCCAFMPAFIHHGRVWYYHQRQFDPAGDGGWIAGSRMTEEIIFSAADGKIERRVAEGKAEDGNRPERLSYFQRVWEDRVASCADVSHWVQDNFTLQFRALDDFRCLGPKWNPPGVVACAYMVPIEIPYYRGRFVLRMNTGDLVCYDLTAPKK